MKQKETPNPSRLRGRGVEVSKTLFYTAGDLAAIVWALSFQPSVFPWRHAISFLESPVKVRKVVKTTLSGDRKDRIVGCTQTVSSYI